METTPRKSIPVVITEIEPILPGFVQNVGQYLNGVHHRVTTNTDTNHVRLLPPRRPRIGNTQIQHIRAASVSISDHDGPLPRWQKDSVILWARELIEAEMFRSGVLAIDPRNPGTVSLSRDRDGSLFL